MYWKSIVSKDHLGGEYQCSELSKTNDSKDHLGGEYQCSELSKTNDFVYCCWF